MINKFESMALVMCLLLFSPWAVGPVMGGIDDGLVAHYSFNGNTADTSGTNNGILFGNATFAGGINGQALSLDAEGNYVEIPEETNVDLDAEFKTISVWFQAGQQDVSQAAILDKTSSSDYDLDLLATDTPGLSRLRFRAFTGTNSLSISGYTSSTQWINAVIVKNDTNISLFTNAILVGTITVNSVLTKNNPLIVGAGGSPYVSGYAFTGLIEDLRFYDRVLTGTEIQALYYWSYPTLSISPGPSTNVWQINWNTISGQTYQPQYNLYLSSTNWINLGPALPATTGSLTISDTNAPPAAQRFYRVALLP